MALDDLTPWSPTEMTVISAGDSSLVHEFSYNPPEGKVFVNAGYNISGTSYEDETFFVPKFLAIRHAGGAFNLHLRRCGPVPKQDYDVNIYTTVATDPSL